MDGREKDGGSFAKKSDAERKLVELESNLLRGQWVDPTDKTTVTEWMRQHAEAKVLKPRTRARVDSYIRNHVEATPLGSRRIGAVRPSEAQAWATDRAQHLAPGTLRNLVTLASGAFEAAVHDHLTAENPFRRVSLPRRESERIVPLTVGQVRAIVDVIGPRYKAMVVTQAGLGLRIGELLALRVQDVDFLRRTVRIEHQVDRLSRELVAPKTPRSRRTVPLPNVVSVELAEHIREFPPAASGLLFHTRDDRPLLHDQYQNKTFVPAALTAGCPKGTTSHDLRHHYASVLLAAGESVIAVAERLGHDNANLVLSTYGHLMPDLEDRTRRAVDEAWKARPAEAATAQGRPQ
ncbi:MAG TPA: site-specific integrase [Pseudonocardia sp.]